MRALVPRTVSPSLGPCPASGGASSFLLASALLAFASTTRLLTSRRARRAMRPIDFCHPKRNCVHPHLVRSRYRFRGFHRVGVSQSLGSARLDRGTERFTTPETALADPKGREPFVASVGWRTFHEPCRAWALSSHGAFRDRTSGIPVASPSSARCPSRFRERGRAGRSRRDHRDLRPVTGEGS